MKALIVSFIAVLNLSVFGQDLPFAMTSIKANYFCLNDGSGIAISLPQAATAAKVWQTDADSKLGVELQLSNFKKGQCEGCFSFEGKLSDQVLVFAEIVNHRLTYKIQDLETGSEFVALEANCK
ncbi:MAG: hypothetical protein COW00_04665 [Bdellovibrio sp. CG12_big_fil_rev_8_21_14_0_65_39_13]|nr:MAG: hypothetical protein COW78_12865 [Bdellovibrio sp. CG22_combo_CG10-13_8_21_14_all_39_27]PIQ61102.1 MAG: hypothetical protein COW00_04665 [Bdellovibrio sp. CG12_big_fil_rev_8_21_14_0_65_39_13]PIR36870.1 MAG: hypothetical protein COV37_01685 [Bdellovibrio sp. CG11_big_fil_rev_8_21_14_0_20_39_38]PJB53998.1 MAG: hypothetical protein CO099_04125 [Bdellovibrio sp. CG_4_9_14_3_um_filter_39_7]